MKKSKTGVMQSTFGHIIGNNFYNAFVISHNCGILVNDISDHLPIFAIGEDNLVICRDEPMVSHTKV